MAQQSGQEQLEAALEVIGGQQPYPHEACQGQPAAASEIKGKEPPTSLNSVESKGLDLVFLSTSQIAFVELPFKKQISGSA